MTKNKNKNNNFIKIYLKGFLMGICDIVPGISGGTIAFITGIYIRLISAIKGLTPKSLFKLGFNILSFDFKIINKQLDKLDLKFLSILFFGIFSAIFLISKLVIFLLENYEAYTLAVFIGLIFASSKIIYNHIESHSFVNILFGLFGLFLGLSMLFLNEGSVLNPSYFYIFLGGFFAISALFLPGISGAFILLAMGLYKFIINALHDILNNYIYLIYFGLGAILGAFFISRFITFLYANDKPKTLYFLLGIVIGSLFIPIKKVVDLSLGSFNLIYTLLLILFFLFGIILVLFIEKKN